MNIERLTTTFIILLLFLLPLVLLLALKEVPQNTQPSLDSTVRLFGEILITQSFKSESNNLSSIGMSIKNPNLLNKEDINLILYRENHEQRKVVLNGRNIPDGHFVKFKFNPIPDSKDKNFTFELSAPSAQQSKPLEIFYTKDGGISFVSFHRPENIFSLIFDVYLKLINKLVKDWLFFIFYSTFIFSLVGYLLKSPIINLFSKFQFFHSHK